MIKVLLPIIAIVLFSSCSKTEEYASATINGIEYAEIRKSGFNYDSGPNTIMILQDSKVALYHTLLEPVKGNYSNFQLDFWLSLDNHSELKINKVYKVLGKKVPREYDWESTINLVEEGLPDGYDEIVYCHKEGVDESFMLEGTFELKKYDSNKGCYYGSYRLINSSEENEKLNIKSNFKFIEDKTQFGY